MKELKWMLCLCLLVCSLNVKADEGALFVEPEKIMHLSPEMMSFLSEGNYMGKGRIFRMNKLLRDLVLDEGLGFKYDKEISLTASEAFHQKRGNCLTFALLYAALGREIDLEITFNRVNVPPRYSSMGRLMVETKHLNLLVKIGLDLYAIDLLPYYRNIFSWETDMIADEVALSSYYNNIGVNAVFDENLEAAMLLFEMAIDMDETSHGGFRNIALLYEIQNDYEKAEGYLLRAAEYGDGNSVVYFLLSELYQYLGDEDKSRYFFSIADKYRRVNPFYYYSSALQFMNENNWDSALKELKLSIKLCNTSHYMFYDLALVYERLGDYTKAKNALKAAIGCASTIELQERYRSVLELVTLNHPTQTQGFLIAMR